MPVLCLSTIMLHVLLIFLVLILTFKIFMLILLSWKLKRFLLYNVVKNVIVGKYIYIGTGFCNYRACSCYLHCCPTVWREMILD